LINAKNAVGVVALLLWLPVFAQGATSTKGANKNAITQEWLSMLFFNLLNEPAGLFEEDTKCSLNVVSRLTENSSMSATLKSATPLLDMYDRAKGYPSSITVDLLWSNVVPTTGMYSLQSVAVNTSYVSSSLFPAEALRAFRDSVEAHKKEQGITQKSQLTAHRTIIAALDKLKKNFSGIQLQVFDGSKQIKREEFVLITPTPSMPKIKVKPVANDTASGKEVVELRLEVAYQRDGKETQSKGGGEIPNVRNDYNSYPAGSWKSVALNREWEVDFGSHFRGGTALLLSRYRGRVDTFRFYIRGKNPNKADIKRYMEDQYANQYWFIKKITHTESSYLQFEKGEKYSAKKLAGDKNASGEPLYGIPKGFGLKQLDNWGTKASPKFATEQHLWHWKANVEGGLEVIKEKKAAVDKAKKTNDGMIGNWDKDNSNNKVSDSMYIEKGTGAGATVLTITEGDITFAVTPTGSQKNVYDAGWIKSFNSGGANPYYKVVQKDKKIKPSRVVNRTNAAGKNYVDEVCRKPD
jgi:hypothetical protein